MFTVETLGYRIINLPNDGSVAVQPAPQLNPPATVSLCLGGTAEDETYVFDLNEAATWRDALTQALALAEQLTT